MSYFFTSAGIGWIIAYLIKGIWWLHILGYLTNLTALYILSHFPFPMVASIAKPLFKIYLYGGGLAALIAVGCRLDVIGI